MHTIVLLSDKLRIDDSLQKAVEALFPECRIEVITIKHPNPVDNCLAVGPTCDA